MMAIGLDFQSIILTLQNYWATQGCLIWQPYYTQVGAGTYNPATFLRVIGPEAWNVAYVEPSIRPDDGRYGDNPNRLQQHYQFQVILKPDPGNPQEIYLGSLLALGIDPLKHDIRFVEDNWESPALGAWGLGWEVWLDSQEITQFTYFQQAGGMILDPVAVEITYGLERIAMALQHVRSFIDIRWNEFYTYGDVNLQGEKEHSTYYFDVAEVTRMRKMYDLFEAEALSSLDSGLVLPAHDYVLKCSHTFNILDTRGAVGVTERQALFGRMRDLSRKVAEAYYQQREDMNFPWLEDQKSIISKEIPLIKDAVTRTAKPMDAPADFLLEIGTEEIPAAEMRSALDQLDIKVANLLTELRLSYDEFKVMGTPRRLVVLVKNLSTRQKDRLTVVKGPPESRAYDEKGNPTKAAIGFVASKRMDVKDLAIEDIDGGRYVTLKLQETGRTSLDILAESLPGLIADIHFDRSMRWNSSGASFIRPIRWLLALHGNNIIPFEFAGVKAGGFTHGLRFMEPSSLIIKETDDYFKMLNEQKIIIDPEQRKATIEKQVVGQMDKLGGMIKMDPDLLEEVTHLVETPTALAGSFEKSHLELPTEVLVSVMKKHLRHFPVWKNETQLLPYFIAIRNGNDQYIDVVKDGNEQVIRARFADAAFFMAEDMKHKLEDFLPRLATLSFQFKLGSMLDKSQRIEKLVEDLFSMINLSDAEKGAALRAAHLCKADLVTHMVIEMTSLQGVIGSYYARYSGEAEEVCTAIREHYLPRYAGDDSPKNRLGLVIGLADRLDSLAGLFAAGLVPSGTKDPFALRRAALGLIQNLISWDICFNLEQGVNFAAGNLPIEMSVGSKNECLEFIVARMKNLFIDSGYRYDIVDAVLAEQKINPAGALRGVKELTKWVSNPNWVDILPAYARCVRITRDLDTIHQVDEKSIKEPAEIKLLDGLKKAEGLPRQPGNVEDLFNVFVHMIPVINDFFDKVLVMSENEVEKSNRLGMLQRISNLAKTIADLSLLEGF